MEQSKEDLIEILIAKNVTLPCPRCNHKKFNILDGYFSQQIQNDYTEFILGGKTLPAIVTTCRNCGYISQHAIGALDLLKDNGKKTSSSQKEEKNGKKKK